MYVDNFQIVVELSVDRFGVSTFFAVQSEEPAPTGGAIRTVVYQSKVAIPCDPKHRVLSLLHEVAFLQRWKKIVYIQDHFVSSVLVCITLRFI